MEHAPSVADLRAAFTDHLNSAGGWDPEFDRLARDYAVALQAEGRTKGDVVDELIGLGISKKGAKAILREAKSWISQAEAPTTAESPEEEVTPFGWRLLRFTGVVLFCFLVLSLAVYPLILVNLVSLEPRVGVGVCVGVLFVLLLVAADLLFLRWVSRKYRSHGSAGRVKPLIVVTVGLVPIVAFVSPLGNETVEVVSGLAFLVAFFGGMQVLLDRSMFSVWIHLLVGLAVFVSVAVMMTLSIQMDFRYNMRGAYFAETIREFRSVLEERPALDGSVTTRQPSASPGSTLGKVLVLTVDYRLEPPEPVVSWTESLLPDNLLASRPSELGAVVLIGVPEVPQDARPFSYEMQVRVTIYEWPSKRLLLDELVPYSSNPKRSLTLMQRRMGYEPARLGFAERLQELLTQPIQNASHPQ